MPLKRLAELEGRCSSHSNPIRSESPRVFRDEITVIERFIEVFGERWGLELLLGNVQDGVRADTGSLVAFVPDGKP